MAAPVESNDDDVPPLEDMSDLLEQVKEIQKTKDSSFKKPSLSDDKVKEVVDGPTPANEEKVTKIQQKKEQKIQHKAKDESFMGLKKGFLLSGFGDDKPKAKRKEDAIPTIKPKLKEKEEEHRIQEVQDALQTTYPFLQNKDWLTGDLLEKVEKHPYLSKVMANSEFASVLSNFEKDPKAAAEQLRNNPQLQHIFRDFCAILGDHFTSLSGSLTAPQSTHQPLSSSQMQNSGVKTRDSAGCDMTVRSSTDPKQPTAEDDAKIKQILADPEVCKIFADEKMKKLMEALRCNPAEAQEMVRSASPELKRKIQKLVDVGLLSFCS